MALLHRCRIPEPAASYGTGVWPVTVLQPRTHSEHGPLRHYRDCSYQGRASAVRVKPDD